MKKMVFVLVFFLIFSIFTLNVDAEWNQTLKEGNWQTCELNTFVADAQRESGKASWTYQNISDFSGFEVIINIDAFEAHRDSWSFKEYIVFDFIYIISGEGHDPIGIAIELEEVKTWFGAYVTRTLYPYLGNPTDEWTPMHWAAAYTRIDVSLNNPIKMWVYITSENKLRCIIHSGDLLAFDKEWDYPFGNQSIDIKFNVYYEGYGAFGLRHNIDIKTGTYVSVIPPAKMQPEDWLSSWWKTVTEYLGFIVTGLQLTFGMALSFVPIFPVILLFWLIDAICTSAYYSNLHPIGVCFTKIYELVRGLISTLVNILNFIRNAISSLWGG